MSDPSDARRVEPRDPSAARHPRPGRPGDGGSRASSADPAGPYDPLAPVRPVVEPLEQDFAHRNGWDRVFETYSDFDLPTYVGPSTFQKLPWVTDPAEIEARGTEVAIVGAPFDDAVSHRPGARFAPRAIREANYTTGSLHSLQLGIEPFEWLEAVDAGDANIVPAWIERGHALIYRKVREVARTGAIPIVFGGDHSITWPSATALAEVRRPGRIGIVHFDAHADTANEDWGVLAGHGTPMRRLIESGAVLGRNFVQVGLRGYWPPVETFEWMRAQGMRWHFMREIEERGADAVIDEAIAEALDGPDAVYLSIDIDVIDPGMAPGTGTPEPGGMLTREVLRAVRRIVGAVELAGMDVVEVSPPYDHAELTAMAASRIALEAISALAVKKSRGERVRFARSAQAAAAAEADPEAGTSPER
ncbi:MAG TPA: agmatinase [Candidatus Limnocylindrales bacterium]